ncbi:MAG TPA: iron ABC transporter permease [Anaerolineae bacterium]|nr:iron ABC transporter permease [Anaerolineae bacterium]
MASQELGTDTSQPDLISNAISLRLRANLRASARHPYIVLGALGVVLLLTLILAMRFGTVSIEPFQIVSIILKRAFGVELGAVWTPAEESIIWQIRFPRVIAAAVVGAGLAGAGVVFQGLLRNSMADPYLLGTSGGAALAATIAFAIPISLGFATFGLVPMAAFCGALFAVLVVYRLARVGTYTPITTLLLAGFAVSSLLAAIMSAMMLLSHGTLERVVLWMLGGVSTSGWSMLLVVAPLIAFGSLVAFVLSNNLNAFLLGEEQAAALGVNVERKKILLVGTGALLTGAAVALSGLVGFVGLIVPHITRIVLGPNHRLLLPASLLCGAIFLVIADLIARTIIAPQELPLGVVTAIVGAPFFIVLLRRAKRQYVF